MDINFNSLRGEPSAAQFIWATGGPSKGSRVGARVESSEGRARRWHEPGWAWQGKRQGAQIFPAQATCRRLLKPRRWHPAGEPDLRLSKCLQQRKVFTALATRRCAKEIFDAVSQLGLVGRNAAIIHPLASWGYSSARWLNRRELHTWPYLHLSWAFPWPDPILSRGKVPILANDKKQIHPAVRTNPRELSARK